jgi:gamma-glutamylcyclotransferase (GGCT)/AIG2-like uncharacterized protein YtfP
MNPHLFVYGSLLSTVAHPMGEKLRGEARLVGEGSIAGRLYRVSWYPALVDADAGKGLVYGEVYALQNPSHALQWLDAYEGIGAHKEARNEYRRAERQVRLLSGGEITAWVYIYEHDVGSLRPIPGGRWSARPD